MKDISILFQKTLISSSGDQLRPNLQALIPISNPTLENFNKTPHHVPTRLGHTVLRGTVSLFAWQSNKAILFYFTQNCL